MKSAYELAMERLEKSKPTVKLNEKQIEELAELDSLYKSRIAEREVFLNAQVAKASDPSEIDQIRRQLALEMRRLQDELEEKKEKVRSSG